MDKRELTNTFCACMRCSPIINHMRHSNIICTMVKLALLPYLATNCIQATSLCALRCTVSAPFAYFISKQIKCIHLKFMHLFGCQLLIGQLLVNILVDKCLCIEAIGRQACRQAGIYYIQRYTLQAHARAHSFLCFVLNDGLIYILFDCKRQ